MTPIRTRFRCPRCDKKLTPWSRALELADAVYLQGERTWLLPAGWFVRWDSELLRGASMAHRLPSFPWLFAPLTSFWLRVHPDPRRTVGCCGLACFGPDVPNLLCACGHEVGLGYRDCCGPHFYSLHESVVREDAPDEAPPTAIPERLARARELLGATIPGAAYDPGSRGVSSAFPETWHSAPLLHEVRLECGGGLDEPALGITSPQLPEGARLIVPLIVSPERDRL